MLQKINAKYPGKEITLQLVAKKVHFLSKLRIPFIIIVSLFFILYIVSTAVIYADIQSELPTVYYGYIGVNWVVLATGFIFYGRRLVNLMPSSLFKKVNKVKKYSYLDFSYPRKTSYLYTFCLVDKTS